MLWYPFWPNSATETLDLGSIPDRVKPKTTKLVFIAFSLLEVLQLQRPCEASSECDRQVGSWQLDSKTERSLRCLLAAASWWIECNYSYNAAEHFLKSVKFKLHALYLPIDVLTLNLLGNRVLEIFHTNTLQIFPPPGLYHTLSPLFFLLL